MRGERFDGHAFVADAARAGAVACLVDHDPQAGIPALVVADTLRALGALASAWRQGFALPVVAVTGSNGKTTVKEMVATILGARVPTLSTRGNFNNEIGLPLTLARLGPEHHAAVLELGANHPGEIARLTEIAQPAVGVITQCAPAHLEGFGSVEGVARAKGELVERLPPGATAVLNVDDPYFDLWTRMAGGHPVVSFGFGAAADVRVRWVARVDGGDVELETPIGRAELRLPLLGRHSAANAAAAAAAAMVAGADLRQIVAGLERMQPVARRLRPLAGPRGSTIVDDTYNANPRSVEAAIEVLAALPGDHWMVLGDMAELGEDAERLHRRVGERAREAGVSRLFTLGGLAVASASGFGATASHFDAVDALVDALDTTLARSAPGEVTVLVKGSRSARMERVVDALTGGR
ncbi:MAG: UDP-N-acetylmuramoyl-tripeptide--D-alanyl-D-alanine ligase [Chromatiales bacterium]|nr:UDP-N-acetylmuramoyl-tripeptide--D-alanyl-D-alanine ligase [Chromatiales bacterium]